MNRRRFIATALTATAGGLLVPEWLLDPPRGRSMVSVPGVWDGWRTLERWTIENVLPNVGTFEMALQVSCDGDAWRAGDPALWRLLSADGSVFSQSRPTDPPPSARDLGLATKARRLDLPACCNRSATDPKISRSRNHPTKAEATT